MEVGTWVGVEEVGEVAVAREVLVADDVDSSDGDLVRVLVRLGEVGAGGEGVARGVDAAVGTPGAAGPRRSRDVQVPRCFRAIHSGAPRAIASSEQVPT
ncbi:hypothetical protein G6014_03680 [Dietzia kunjamensis]|uniref:hypothetical protein n=1 Tax=Dietzia kunjamensis TaxID=322509 RepID=UPI0013297324|nr:hypothetical protein [Dietzia kunjamensis]MBB1011389.1 hypothetical protein [Dietzia kunjamensis]MVZ91134.1 hypothetical protein [Microbacter sp. ANSKLAB05]